MDLEPRHIQDLIHEAIYEFGPDSFVGVRQATLYTILFCSRMSIRKVRRLKFRNVYINESSVTFKFTEENQCSIRPDSLCFQGIMCPFRLIVCYLSLRKKLDYISANDFLFPSVCARYENVLPTHDIEIQLPPTPVSYIGILNKQHLKMVKLILLLSGKTVQGSQQIPP